MARQMKDSGVEWIREIPEDWKFIKLKYILKPNCVNLRVGPFGSALSRADIREEGYWVYNQRCVLDRNFKHNDICVDENKYRELIGFKVQPRDILITTRGSIGKVAIVPDNAREGILHPCIIKFVVNNELISNELVEIIFNESDIIYNQILRESNTTTIDVIYSYTLKELLLPVIPKEEQEKVIEFLDEKVGEIDSVIAKTKETIEDYKKYKQVIITDAVTKGLNPDVEMKESKGSYLGMIPAHWIEKRLRFLGMCQNGISKSSEYFGEGYPFVSYGDVYKNYALPKNGSGLIKSSEEDRRIYSVQYGDVFFTRTSETIEEVGFTSTCLNTIEDAAFAGFVIRFRPNNQKELLPEFSKYYFRSEAHRKFFVKEMNLVTRASLSQELLKKLPVLLPPLEEQREIAEYLDAKCSEIDKLVAKKEELLVDLENYKKSLIYEYVTGKKEVE